jgi:hypothetical protein
MTTPYDISKLIPLEARKRACEAVYSTTTYLGEALPARTSEGCCPLGFALAFIAAQTCAANPDDNDMLCAYLAQPASPDAEEVPALLQAYGVPLPSDADPTGLVEAALAFNRDWDSNHIPDLFAALDVPRPDGGAE